MVNTGMHQRAHKTSSADIIRVSKRLKMKNQNCIISQTFDLTEANQARMVALACFLMHCSCGRGISICIILQEGTEILCWRPWSEEQC